MLCRCVLGCRVELLNIHGEAGLRQERPDKYGRLPVRHFPSAERHGADCQNLSIQMKRVRHGFDVHSVHGKRECHVTRQVFAVRKLRRDCGDRLIADSRDVGRRLV